MTYLWLDETELDDMSVAEHCAAAEHYLRQAFRAASAGILTEAALLITQAEYECAQMRIALAAGKAT